MKLAHPSAPRGFTIIEFMVYVAIVSVALTVFANFTISITQNTANLKAKRAVQQNAELLLAKISQEIRYSQNVVAASGSTLTLTNSSGSTTTISWNSTSKEVNYNGAPLSNTYVNVTSLTFVSVTGISGGVTVSLTVQPKYAGGLGSAYTITLTTTAVSRQQQVYS